MSSEFLLYFSSGTFIGFVTGTVYTHHIVYKHINNVFKGIGESIHEFVKDIKEE